jgi:hypothetical protein
MGTFKPSVIALYLKSMLEAKNGLGLFTPPIVAFYYGDQEYIPEVPAVCIEPARLARTYAGAAKPPRMDNNFLIGVLVYSASIDGNQEAQMQADLLTEQISNAIDIDGLPDDQAGTRFGGNVVHGWVADYSYGYVTKRTKLMRANRLVVGAFSKTSLTEEGA